MDDNELITGLKNKNQKAIEYIFNSYNKILFKFVQGIINNKEEADDIVAECFIKLFGEEHDFERHSDISHFLYETAKNDCLDYLMYMKEKTTLHEKIIYLLQNDDNFFQSKIAKTEVLRLIMSEVECLPPLRKEICKLIFVNGLSIFEIATRLNITIDTVRVQKAKAFASIRTFFLKDELL
ncbi:MAG TPA: sigma-70 family RNA polymerase sigma factor [Chitinophagaceae bacterium]